MNISQARLTLFFSARSPFARRVRIAIQRLGVSVTLREVDLFKILPPDFVSVGPLGRVPVLKIEGISEKPITLYESEVILQFLHENYGKRIWPEQLDQKLKIQEASALCLGGYDHMVLYYLESLRIDKDVALQKEYTEVLEKLFSNLELRVADGFPFEFSKIQLTQAGYDLQTLLDYAELRVGFLYTKEKFPRLKAFQERQRPRQDLILTQPPPAT